MIDYRRINREDVDAVSAFALRALTFVAGDEDRLHIAPAKVKNSVAYFAKSGAEHFQLAAFEDHVCVGAIAAFSAEMAYFERKEAHVAFCYSTRVGVGMRLARSLMAWAKADMLIRRVTWTMNVGEYGERMARVINRRFGFEPYQTLVWVKE